MGKALDLFKEHLDNICARFVYDVPARSNEYTDADDICEAFKDIEREVDGKPGDPGPMYKLSERVRRVMYEARK